MPTLPGKPGKLDMFVPKVPSRPVKPKLPKKRNSSGIASGTPGASMVNPTYNTY